MPTTQEEIDNFHRFASKERTNTDYTLDELYDRWRIENPTDQEHRENVAAIAASIRDMEAGDTGTPAKEVVRKLREKFSLASDE